MKFLLRLPLHYQILIALVLGTAVGLLINPGAVELPDRIHGTLEPADDRITFTELDAVGRVLVRETIPNEQSLKDRYPELAKRYLAQEPRQAIEVRVTEPRVQIVEEGKAITIRYSRRQDGRPAVTTIEAATTEHLAQQSAYWKQVHEKHGGGAARQTASAAKAVGDIFLRLLKMITVPLIVTSLVTGISGLGDAGRFGAMFGKTILYYFTTSMLAILTGLMMINLIQPGVGAMLPGGGEAVVAPEGSLADVFRGMIDQMIPPNPVQALAAGDFLAIITFSILVGIFIIYTGGKSGEILRNFFEAGFHVMMSMTMAIIRLAPIGVFAFMLYATATQGLEVFQILAKYMVTVFLALVIHAAIVLPLIVKWVGRRSPWGFAQAMSPALMTAFSTASSNATLPLTLTSVEKRAGISNRVSSFVLPLGATINMDGTALYEVVAVLFIAQATPGFELTLGSQVLVAVTALLASVGAAGIPHAGLVMMAIVLQAVGLPLEAQGIIIAVDRVLDMCRTAVNVWSDSCGCAVLARFEEPEARDRKPLRAESMQPTGELI